MSIVTGNSDKAPFFQSIINLTLSLRHQLIKYMLTTLLNTVLFLLEICENLLQRFSHFPNKNNTVFVIFKF